jgi:hypothetical protein
LTPAAKLGSVTRKISYTWLGDDYETFKNARRFKTPRNPTDIIMHFYSDEFDFCPISLKTLGAGEFGRDCQVHDFLSLKYANKKACFEDLQILSKKYLGAGRLLDPNMREDIGCSFFNFLDMRAAVYKVVKDKITSIVELWRIRNVSGSGEAIELKVIWVVIY